MGGKFYACPIPQICAAKHAVHVNRIGRMKRDLYAEVTARIIGNWSGVRRRG